jgi:hypothetical protein
VKKYGTAMKIHVGNLVTSKERENLSIKNEISNDF